MPKSKKTLSVQEEMGVREMLKSQAFKTFVLILDSLHPVHKTLDVTATLMQRAFYQTKCETYEDILNKLRLMSLEEIKASLEADYQPETPTK